MKNSVKGIDVSRHQGNIDWEQAAGAGVKFAILRAGYGKYRSQKDSRFEQNYAGCAAAGIPVGAYWYSYAVSRADAEQEAEACLACLAGKTFPCGVWFDQEYEPGILALSNAERGEIVKTFVRRLQAAGYDCGLYASEDFIKNRLDRAALGGIGLWTAHYGSACGIEDTVMWQYSSRGSVPGIAGNVDLDLWYRAESAPPTALRSVTILNMSRGDFAALTQMAENLGLSWEAAS